VRSAHRVRLFILRLALGALAGAAFLAGPAAAGDAAWTAFGPGGGNVISLAVDPRNPAVVYAVGRPDFYAVDGSLFKSVDGGATWKALVQASLVALDPEHPSTVYAGGSGLWRSDDEGRTWTDISPRLGDETLYIESLAVVPGGGLLAQGIFQMLRSADGGRTWSSVREDRDFFQAILVDRADPGRVYYLSDTALSRSDDGGVHWTLAGQPANGAYSFYGALMALAPSAPKTLYLLLGPESKLLFRSDDGAATWHRVAARGLSLVTPRTLLVDPRSPDTIYAAGEGGIFTSTNGGRSWSILNAGLPRGSDNRLLPVLSLALAPSQPETLFAGMQSWGVARRDSSGTRWRTGLQRGLTAAAIVDLQFHPLRPGTLYLFQSEGRSFRSADGGQTWQPFVGAHGRKGMSGLAFDLTNSDLLYGTDPVGTWKSADNGETWTRLSSPKGRLALLGPHTLIGAGCGLQQSTDGGRTWKEIVPCLTPDGEGGYRIPLAVVADPKTPGTAYVEFEVNGDTHPFRNEVFRTQDGGATWTLLALEYPIGFAVAPSDSRILYAVDEPAYNSLLRSVDGGGSWEVVNRDLPSLRGALVVHAADPNTLYLVADSLQISRDGGATFESVDAPMEPWELTAWLWTDSAHPGVLYGTASRGGLFVGRFE
jgi:photosystem II stability/assembly factor-like uncharacterized protein